MNNKCKIVLISTGGTIEKTYNELEGILGNNEISVLDIILEGILLEGINLTRIALMNKDSLTLTEKDFDSIISTVETYLHSDSDCQGIIIPGGFGKRGMEGKILVAEYCRNHKIPILGICLGMHAMCIQAARQVLGNECQSEEFCNQSPHLIVKSMEHLDQDNLGGTMQLGLHTTIISASKKTQTYQTYFYFYRQT